MTAQVTEKLRFEGRSLSLCEEPLGEYLGRLEKRPKLEVVSTALWRGYIGHWEIESGRLYLNRLEIFPAEAEWKSTNGIHMVFPGASGPVFAHWYSGVMRCPEGALLNYVHLGYSSTYERDLHIAIEAGRVLWTKQVVNGEVGDGEAKGYRIGAATTFRSNREK
jgi:hypothetical protein